MKKYNYSQAALVGVIFWLFSSIIIYNITLKGAESGGANISKAYTISARSGQQSQQIVGFSALFGGIAGLVSFGITLLITKKK